MAITKIQSESLNLADTYDFTGTVTGAGGNMKPAFHAYLGSAQTGLSDSATATLACENEIYDTDSAYNTSTYTFTPQTAGKYFVYAQAVGDSSADSNLRATDLYLYKNTSLAGLGTMNYQGNPIRVATLYASAVLDMNGSSDYVKAQMYLDTGNGGNWLINGHSTRQYTYFGAYKIIT